MHIITFPSSMDTSGSGDDYGWDWEGGGRMMAIGVAMGKKRGEEDPVRELKSERSGGPDLKVTGDGHV